MLKKSLATLVIMSMIFTATIYAQANDYGASGAKDKKTYTIEQMLTYAIQDEYLARQEYQVIMEKYGEQRPFSNIIKAEEYHITLLKPLFETYNIDIPTDTSTKYTILPESLEEAFKAGVKAEIENIEMYESFLSQDKLPSDLKAVFENLKSASEKHLKAFEQGSSRGNGTRWNRK